jgi:hypothetical protein
VKVTSAVAVEPRVDLERVGAPARTLPCELTVSLAPLLPEAFPVEPAPAPVVLVPEPSAGSL